MRAIFLATASLPILLVNSCNPVKDIRTAEAAVTTFHSRWDAGDLETIYDTSNPEFRAAASKADAMDFINKVHDNLGKVTASKQTGWKANSINMNTRIVSTYATTFERGTGTETFTYAVKGNEASLVGWYINSNDLVKWCECGFVPPSISSGDFSQGPPEESGRVVYRPLRGPSREFGGMPVAPDLFHVPIADAAPTGPLGITVPAVSGQPQPCSGS